MPIWFAIRVIPDSSFLNSRTCDKKLTPTLEENS
jgi:hypothetical protein